MGRILFIGDSHAAHLKSCIGERTGYQWLAAPSREPYNLSLLKADVQRIYSDHPELLKVLEHYNQPSEVSLNVEEIILVGLRTEFPYKLLEHYNLSKQAVIQTMNDYLQEQSILIKLAKLLRESGFSGKLTAIPNPLLSNTLRAQRIPTAPGIKPSTKFGAYTNEPPTQYLEFWFTALKQQLQPWQAQLVTQPSDTIDNLYTYSKYALGDNSPGEIRHMNAEFWQKLTKTGLLL